MNALRRHASRYTPALPETSPDNPLATIPMLGLPNLRRDLSDIVIPGIITGNAYAITHGEHKLPHPKNDQPRVFHNIFITVVAIDATPTKVYVTKIHFREFLSKIFHHIFITIVSIITTLAKAQIFKIHFREFLSKIVHHHATEMTDYEI